MKQIFSYLDEMARFPKICMKSAACLCFFILFGLIYLKFTAVQNASFIYTARYAVRVCAAVFAETTVFSVVVNRDIQNK